MDRQKREKQLKAFGKAYASARRHKGWTHMETGRRIGVSDAASRMYEHGRRTPSASVFLAMLDVFEPQDAVAIAEAFRMTPERLAEILREAGRL